MQTSICILNYNSWQDTIECVQSLIEQTVDNFNIIIVDNSSDNNSVQMIEQSCLNSNIKYITLQAEENILQDEYQIYIVKSPKNGGFSYGNNVGFLFSKKQLHSDNIIFLNNDTVVTSNFVEKMQQSFHLHKKRNQKIALGCYEYNYFTKELSHKGFHYLHLFTGLSFSIPIFPYFKYICGACLMVDINAPTMDENYFLYFDDIQYTKILKKNGYKIRTTNATKYFHKISATTNLIKKKKLEYQFESTWQFYDKNYSFFRPIVYLIRKLQYLLTQKKEVIDIINSTYKRY